MQRKNPTLNSLMNQLKGPRDQGTKGHERPKPGFRQMCSVHMICPAEPCREAQAEVVQKFKGAVDGMMSEADRGKWW